MGKLYEYLKGCYIVRRGEASASKVVDLMIRNAIPFYNVRQHKNGDVTFRVSRQGLKKYLSVTKALPPDDEKIEYYGLFALASKYKTRIGFFIGAIIFAVILCASSLFVWDINIDGEETLSEDEILGILGEHGVYIGAYIPSVDTERAGLELVVGLEKLSFASINLRGTVANVVIREETSENAVEDGTPSNLIAICDGQIETVELLGGVPAVRNGEIVKEGQLLASGIIDSQAIGYRLVRARGNVYARVTLGFDSEVSLKTERKTYTGREKTQTSIKFFSKKINLFGNKEIFFREYDTIEEETRVCLFGKIKLPIFVSKTVLSEYVSDEAFITEQEALEKAGQDIMTEIGKALDGAQVLARYTDVTKTEESVKIHCDVECIIDIAKEVPINAEQEK